MTMMLSDLVIHLILNLLILNVRGIKNKMGYNNVLNAAINIKTVMRNVEALIKLIKRM